MMLKCTLTVYVMLLCLFNLLMLSSYYCNFELICGCCNADLICEYCNTDLICWCWSAKQNVLDFPPLFCLFDNDTKTFQVLHRPGPKCVPYKFQPIWHGLGCILFNWFGRIWVILYFFVWPLLRVFFLISYLRETFFCCPLTLLAAALCFAAHYSTEIYFFIG